MSREKITAVVLGEFDSPKSLMAAARKTREAGFTSFDSHSPFPIHGMDDAMGLRRSPLGYVVGIAGTLGLIGALALQWWTSAVDMPLNISGKPFFSYQAFIPITFALTVLMAAFGAFFGMLHLNRLPRLHDQLFESEKFARVTDGGFFISIESIDPKFDPHKTTEFLKSVGATEVELIKEES